MDITLYKLTENNVNGSGESASEYVAFNRPLEREQVKALLDKLSETKKARRNDDYDTGEIVSEALGKFREAGYPTGTIVSAPYAAELEF